MLLTVEDREILNAISLYLATRKTSLRSAMAMRAPLSSEQVHDLRVHYSTYLSSVVSAVELLRETTHLDSSRFIDLLESRMVCSGHPDGKANYSYVRELRNAIVHRGLDISAAAHFHGGIPFFIAPPAVSSRSGKATYARFGFYLLNVIATCEVVVGPVVEEHLATVGVLERTPDPEDWMNETLQLVHESDVIPEEVKTCLPGVLRAIDISAVHNANIATLREALQPYAALPNGA